MSISDDKQWQMIPFQDCLDKIKMKKPRKLLARDYKPSGKIPIIDQGQKYIAGWTNDDSVSIREQLPFILFGDHTRAFKYVNFPFALGADGTQLLKPSSDFNPRFFYYACLHLPLPSRGYNRHFSILKEQEIRRPPKPEQERIAAVLWKIQRAIETEEKLIETARELKQSVMHQLFTRGLRGESQKETEIGPLPESWELRPFETLREFLQYGTSAKCGYHGKGNPVLRIPNIAEGRVNTGDVKWCELNKREIVSYELELDDLIFIRTNGVRERVGGCAVYRGQPKKALFASYLIRARLKPEDITAAFFQYFSMTSGGSLQLAGRASPAADGKFNINTKTIDSVLVPVPALPEQNEIVSILEAIDLKFCIHNHKYAILQELFKTMLHHLMTGQIRLADLDIDVSEIQP
ncbi:MAG: restriction endonuclease subunit S [Candidatus Abyssobacteria bacterium SURF_5]|uniref:Restriction endonuclease subunit S n=1 Tax=Abyssobacteria bacterium (strain SURF_5) TaxID=2093360 RepID=A0A3A4P961_ABYX5|nr:MAG: restriction endonuclease subunit S [Candidatus Abyssubacteria bacterium SURF_5]